MTSVQFDTPHPRHLRMLEITKHRHLVTVLAFFGTLSRELELLWTSLIYAVVGLVFEIFYLASLAV